MEYANKLAKHLASQFCPSSYFNNKTKGRNKLLSAKNKKIGGAGLRALRETIVCFP